MRFLRVRNVFISKLHPDYLGGFPGFYLSSRESSALEIDTFKVNVVGPKGLR
jgi:ribonuclease BN (tRNA processing enzyme)